MLVICDMVIERYIFNRTTIWQIDVVTYAIVDGDFRGQPLRAVASRACERGHPAAAYRASANALLAGARHRRHFDPVVLRGALVAPHRQVLVRGL